MDNNPKMGQVIPFVRSAETLRALARRHKKNGNYLKALELFRLSLEKEPDHARALLDIAFCYAQLGAFKLSNRILFSLFSDEQVQAEAFFQAGANFYAMRLYFAARDCLLLYIQRDAAHKHSHRAYELLALTEESMQRESPMDRRVNRRAERALLAISEGKAELAVRLMRRALVLDRQNGGLHALLAFALLDMEAHEGALMAARRAIRLSGKSPQAVCALVSCLAKNGAEKPAHSMLARAITKANDPESLDLLLRTACDLGHHETAFALITRLETLGTPTDDILHLKASAALNLGKTEEALRCLRLLRRIDPLDPVAEHRLRMAADGTLPLPVSYSREISPGDVLLSLQKLRDFIREGTAQLALHWQSDDQLEKLVRWGLSSDEPGLSEAMMGLIASIGEKNAQRPLLDLLGDPNVSDELKRSALAALCVMGAGGPHYALIKERMTQVYVSRNEKNAQGEAQKSLADTLISRVPALNDHERKTLLTLCRLAYDQNEEHSAAFYADGVEMAFRSLRGEDMRLMEMGAFAKRRRLMRFARQLVRQLG